MVWKVKYKNLLINLELIKAYTFCLLSAYTYAHDTENLEGISKANMFISQATILNEVYGLGYKKI